jgi:hypothetical protein
MANLFAFLFLISFLVMLAGLVVPSLIGKIFKREFTRKKVLMIFGGIALASFVFIGILGDKKTTTENKEISKELVPTEVAKPIEYIAPTAVLTSAPNTKIITVDDISMAILLFNPKVKDINFTDGRFITFLADGKSNLSLDGSRENISEIRLNLNHLDKSSVSADTGVSLVSALIKGSIPEWTDVDAWLVSAYKSFSTTKEEYLYKEKKVGNKTVGLTYNVTESSLYLTITNK